MGESHTVFIVDDDEAIRAALKRVFRSAGFLAVTFGSAEAFLRAFVPCEGSCLILDLRMPGMSGLELQRELRVRDLSVPIIFLTAHADVPVTVRVMKDGAFDLVEKPFSNDLLIERVQQAIAREHARKRMRDAIRSACARLAKLTAREREVAEYLADGVSAVEVGKKLSISSRTVEVHRVRIANKVGVRSIAELAKLHVLASFFSETVGETRCDSSANGANAVHNRSGKLERVQEDFPLP